MKPGIVQEFTERDVLVSEKNKTLKNLVTARVDIQTLESVAPETVISQQKQVNPNFDQSKEPGPDNPTHIIVNITAAQTIDDREGDIAAYETRLEAIGVLLAQHDRNADRSRTEKPTEEKPGGKNVPAKKARKLIVKSAEAEE